MDFCMCGNVDAGLCVCSHFTWLAIICTYAHKRCPTGSIKLCSGFHTVTAVRLTAALLTNITLFVHATGLLYRLSALISVVSHLRAFALGLSVHCASYNVFTMTSSQCIVVCGLLNNSQFSLCNLLCQVPNWPLASKALSCIAKWGLDLEWDPANFTGAGGFNIAAGGSGSSKKKW